MTYIPQGALDQATYDILRRIVWGAEQLAVDIARLREANPALTEEQRELLMGNSGFSSSMWTAIEPKSAQEVLDRTEGLQAFVGDIVRRQAEAFGPEVKHLLRYEPPDLGEDGQFERARVLLVTYIPGSGVIGSHAWRGVAATWAKNASFSFPETYRNFWQVLGHNAQPLSKYDAAATEAGVLVL